MKKFSFKQISAVLASAMLGITGIAAMAAAYPQPMVVGTTGDFAVVYGSDAATSDQTQATSIANQLQAMVSGSVSVEGGESFTLDKTSDHFNFNNTLNSVYSTLDDEEMEDFLADGTYDDGDVDTDYEQSITLGSKVLTLFADTDYDDDTPTVGFYWTNAETILSYTIDFDDEVNYTEMVETDMPLLGGNYYVLAASDTQIDILDSAESRSLNQGEEVTLTIDGTSYDVSAFIYDDGAKFTVNGVTSDTLDDGEYDEISEDLYVVAKEVNYVSKESLESQVEFALGIGKIELINGSEAELNGEDIDGLEVTIDDNTGLDSLTLTWKSDRETFLTKGNSITLPELGVISLAFGGLDYPSDSETISVENGETLTIKMDNFDIPIAWYNGTDALLGEEDNLLVVATSVANYTDPAINLTGGLDLVEDNRFIVTSIGDDLSDVEILYYEVNTIENDTDILVELEDLIGDNDITFDDIESDDVGSVTVELVAVNGTTSGRAYINFTKSVTDATIYYNRLVSDKGLVIEFPTDASTYTDGTGGALTFMEADKEEDLMQGVQFVARVKNTTNEKLHVSTYDTSTNASREEESDDNFIGYVKSDLASRITSDETGDENDFSVEYFGKEVTADVRVVAGGTIGSEELGNVLVTDAQVSAVQGRNLIVVGGSAVNEVAAELVGVNYPTYSDAWTAATGVGSGQLLIQSFNNPYQTGKVAVLVAGYEAADTIAGAARLINQPSTIDTTAGNKYVYQTGTEGASTLVSGP